MYLTQRFLSTVVNSFPTYEVRVMGLKLLEDVGSELAAALPICLTDASFHTLGTIDSAQQRLKILCKVNSNAGHLLKILYEILSNEDGDELLRDFFTAASISVNKILSVLNIMVDGLDEGIHAG